MYVVYVQYPKSNVTRFCALNWWWGQLFRNYRSLSTFGLHKIYTYYDIINFDRSNAGFWTINSRRLKKDQQNHTIIFDVQGIKLYSLNHRVLDVRSLCLTYSFNWNNPMKNVGFTFWPSSSSATVPTLFGTPTINLNPWVPTFSQSSIFGKFG